jgi:hypothetical protein
VSTGWPKVVLKGIGWWWRKLQRCEIKWALKGLKIPFVKESEK